MLEALEIRTKLPRLMSHNLAGQFVSNVLPTTIGGDVLRVSRLSRETGEPPGTFASVVLERLTGWLVLPVITVVGFAVNPGLRHLGSATRVALALALGTLVLLVGVLAAAGSTRIGGRFATNAGWRRFVGAVHLGIARLRSHPGAAANVLVAGFAYQLALVLAAVAAAQALGLRPAGPHRAAGVLPGGPHRPGAADLDVGPGGARRCVRAVPRAARRRQRAGDRARAAALPPEPAVSLLGAPAFAAGGRPARPRAHDDERTSAGPAAGPDDDSGESAPSDGGAATAATAVPPRRQPSRGRACSACAGGARSVYIVLVYVAYSAVRNQFGSGAGDTVDPDPAFHHGEAIIQLQRNMRPLLRGPRCSAGTSTCRSTASSASGTSTTACSTSWSPAFALVWCTGPGPERYRVWRNTLAATTLVALVGFATFSLMPPRLMDDPGIYGGCQVYARPAEALPDAAGDPPCDEFGFVDTIAVYGGWASFGSDEMAAVSNQYAAMPSMHIGWSTWCALVMVPLIRRRWLKVLASGLPALHAVLHHRDRPTTTGSTAGRPGVPRRRLPVARATALAHRPLRAPLPPRGRRTGRSAAAVAAPQ